MNKKFVISVAAILGLILVASIAFLGLDKPKEVAPSIDDIKVEKNERDITLEEAKYFNDDIYFNNASFNEIQDLLTKKNDIFVFFYKPSCIYCKTASPKVAEVAKEKGVKVISINLREYPEAAKAFSVSRVPTLTVFHEGKVKISTEVIEEKLQNPKVGDDEKTVFNQFFELYASK